MPKGGGNKKPTQMKVLQGTFRKDRSVEEEPEFKEANIIAPDYMEGLALLTWQDYAPKLAAARVLKETDLKALESYCFAYQNFREAQQILTEEGPVKETASGSWIKNPAATVVKEAMSEMRAYSASLGLDPVARTRINVGKKDKDTGNAFAKLQRPSTSKNGG